MKYLIDLVDKQVGSLARQYKNLKKRMNIFSMTRQYVILREKTL